MICDECIWAEWKRKSNGGLHHDGSGRCSFPIPIIEVPQAFYWIGTSAPRPSGGYIERKKEFDDCKFYKKSGD